MGNVLKFHKLINYEIMEDKKLIKVLKQLQEQMLILTRATCDVVDGIDELKKEIESIKGLLGKEEGLFEEEENLIKPTLNDTTLPKYIQTKTL